MSTNVRREIKYCVAVVKRVTVYLMLNHLLKKIKKFSKKHLTYSAL